MPSQRAWTFDADAFHAWLEAEVIVGGEFRPERLRSLAIEVAERDDPAIAQYLLDALPLARDDEESWENVFGDDGYYHVHKWYVVAMAAHLTPCPGLGLSWLTLERLLGLTGIAASEVNRLTWGEPLETLVVMHGDERLRLPVGRALDDIAYGGWHWRFHPDYGLGLDTCLHKLPPWVPSGEAAQLAAAVEAARTMLATARERGAALRLVIS